MAWWDPEHPIPLVALRAALAVILLGLLLGVGLATAVLSNAREHSTTIAPAPRMDAAGGVPALPATRP